MSFASFAYIVFLPLVCVLYYVTPKSWRWLFLLCASCLFYMWLIPSYILVIGFLIIMDYSLGIKIEAAQSEFIRRFYLDLSIVGNLGILCLFKYFSFISALIYGSGIFKTPVSLYMALPLGISFHVFQSLSYTIDVYRRKCKAERHLGYYALFVMVFFQMVAGPIERAGHLIPQLEAERNFSASNAGQGLRLILWGYFQKIVVADKAASFVNLTFAQAGHFRGLAHLISVFFFSFQIYCDFSGYSDIARGSAKLLNINVVRNFEAPYLADSPSEFWRRWHISLSQWFRDYVYIPLGGSRVSFLKWIGIILIVFSLSGIWHGASWTFFWWGLFHAVGLIGSRVGGVLFPTIARSKHFLIHRARLLWTFAFVSSGWILFRAQSLNNALYIYKKIGADLTHLLSGKAWRGALESFGIPGSNWMVLIFGITLLMAIQISRPEEGWENWFLKRPAWARAISYYVAVFTIVIFSDSANQTFIYFQF
jgi:alginate O-acetyltransferase complex protein AlgI